MKRLLLGDEAIALGAINAGLSGVYAYPGTPSTEITEFIQNDPTARERKIHSRWCTNEKTAMEAGIGMSFAGKRALVCMKHVGLNVAADPFVNSALTGTNGGLVVLVADDPFMHSSQNEQDSRYYAKFALLPTLEPSSQQEAYEMIGEAFDLSEMVHLPVLFRVVTRLAHSRAAIEVGETRAMNQLHPENDPHWVLHPSVARKQYASLIEKQKQLAELSEASPRNQSCPDGAVRTNAAPLRLCEPARVSNRLGVVCCGIGYNYVREAELEEQLPILKISQYPLPEKKIKELAAQCEAILVVEDGQPFAEEQIRGMLGAGYTIKGRLTGDLPRTGELAPDTVAAALGAHVEKTFTDIHNVVRRPPALCNGCGHRDMYTALNEVVRKYPGSRVFGDIGCYTLGVMPPFESINSTVDMGASIPMAKGAADAGVFPAVAVIGDSTFTHSGITGLLDAVNENTPITVMISDNLTTAMTGGQQSAGTGRIEQICKGIGVAEEHIRVVVPLPQNMAEITAAMQQEIEYQGVSVIIARRECLQTLSRKLKSQKK